MSEDKGTDKTLTVRNTEPGQYVIERQNEYFCLTNTEEKADLIVRSVNTCKGLVEALKKLTEHDNDGHSVICEMTTCNVYGQDCLSLSGPVCTCSIPGIKALIAEAEGE